MYEENDYCVFHMTVGMRTGIATDHTGPLTAIRPENLTQTRF